jgi:alpha-beta hydrolase superfamily lysophospholipase
MIVSAKMIQEQVKCEGEDKNNGDYVIATARKPEVLVFEKATSTNFIAVQLDLLEDARHDSFCENDTRTGQM